MERIHGLRVMEDRAVRPVGGNRETPVDVRIIAATNHDLKKMCSGGRFRSDLFYRLCVLEIRVPPLRERLDETVEADRECVPHDAFLLVEHESVPPRARLLQRLLHRGLGFGIQRRGGLVQHQDGRVAQKRPGDGQPLALPSGQPRTPFPDACVVAVGHGFDKRLRLLDQACPAIQAADICFIGEMTEEELR